MCRCHSTGAAPSASQSIRRRRHALCRAPRRRRARARRTAARRGSTADSRRLRSSRSRSALPTGRCMLEPSRARSIEATTAVSRRELEGLLELPLAADLELPAAAVDVPCSLDRSEPARCRRRARRNRARRAHALDRRRRDQKDQRPWSQPDVHSLAWHPRVEGRAYEAGGGGAAWSEDGGDSWRAADEGRDRRYVVGGGGSCGSRALVRVREHRAVCSARDARRRPACAHLPEERRGWDQLAGGLPTRCLRCRMRSSLRTVGSSPGSRTASSGRAPIGTAGARVSSTSRFPACWARLRVVGALVVLALVVRADVRAQGTEQEDDGDVQQENHDRNGENDVDPAHEESPTTKVAEPLQRRVVRRLR